MSSSVPKTSLINGTKGSLIAAVDIGSTKIACFIAQSRAKGQLKVIGIGHQVSKGIKSGNIIDMDAVEVSIRAAVESAEQMAGENVKHITVCFSGGKPTSKLVSFDVSIAGHKISDADLNRALDPAWLYAQQSGDTEVIHTLPVGYSIDGTKGVNDPRGMYGDRLGVNMHIITAAASAVRNIELCVHRCHLDIEKFVVAPYASGVACLVEDEKHLGAICLDMGGGTTTVSVFLDNQVMFLGSIPIGGDNITKDIARGLSTPLSNAERMKNLYGSALPATSDDQELIRVPLVGEDDNEFSQVPRSMLIGIVRPRLEEIFELVSSKINSAGFKKSAGRRVVLTGGASQLTGLTNLATTILDKQVRVGRPINLEGLAESVNGPAFSACAGLVQLTYNERSENLNPISRRIEFSGGRFARFGQWLRENI